MFRSFSSAVTSTFTPNMTVYSTSSVPNFNLAAAFSVVLALATFVLSFAFLKFTQRKEADEHAPSARRRAPAPRRASAPRPRGPHGELALRGSAR